METRSVVRDLVHRAAADSGIFDVGSDALLGAAARVIDQRCQFDFKRLNPRLQRESGSSRIKVRFASLDKLTAAEVNPDGRPVVVQVNSDMKDNSAEEVALVVLAETAHVVDQMLVTPEQRKAIYMLFHRDLSPDQLQAHLKEHPWFKSGGPFVGSSKHVMTRGSRRAKGESLSARDYFMQVGESFMGAFIAAYTDFVLPPVLVRKFAHKPTPAIGRGVRKIIG